MRRSTIRAAALTPVDLEIGPLLARTWQPGQTMRHEVERTSAVDWQNSGGPDSLMGAALWLVAVGGNVLVWLVWRALGRGWTLRSFDEAGVLQAKRRYRRRADAEKAMTRLRDQQRGPKFDDP